MEPEFGAVVMQRRTERHDRRIMVVVRARRAPPSPAAGRALLTSPSPNDMQSPNTLQERILAVLERNDGKCLDPEAERQQIADDLVDMLDWFYGDRGI